MPSKSLTDIAAEIGEHVSTLTAALKASNTSQPSFQPGGLEKYPAIQTVQEPRQALIELANDLYHLALGPGEYIKQQAFLVRTSLLSRRSHN